MVERSQTGGSGTAVPEGEIIAPGADDGTVVATAQLPNLQIEVVHGVAPDGSGERISIHLQATPSFEAFGQVLEATNPFALWTQVVQLAWAPFLAGNAFLPFGGMTVCGPARPKTLKGPGTREG